VLKSLAQVANTTNSPLVMKNLVKNSGLFFYSSAFIFNAGIVIVLLHGGGSAAFTTRTAWICSALAAYFLAVIGVVIKTRRPSHPLLVYGIPLVSAMLITHEVIHGLTLHLITLAMMWLGRIMDIRYERRRLG
jgi:hypothetical protein